MNKQYGEHGLMRNMGKVKTKKENRKCWWPRGYNSTWKAQERVQEGPDKLGSDVGPVA